jgi:hypothetical protein
MVLDRTLATAGYENQFLDSGIDRLFRSILDQWFVHDREHFLGIGLGRGQKPGTKPGNRKHGFPDLLVHKSLILFPGLKYQPSLTRS